MRVLISYLSSSEFLTSDGVPVLRHQGVHVAVLGKRIEELTNVVVFVAMHLPDSSCPVPAGMLEDLWLSYHFLTDH